MKGQAVSPALSISAEVRVAAEEAEQGRVLRVLAVDDRYVAFHRGRRGGRVARVCEDDDGVDRGRYGRARPDVADLAHLAGSQVREGDGVADALSSGRVVERDVHGHVGVGAVDVRVADADVRA